MRPNYFDFDQTDHRRAAAIAMARPIAYHRLPPAPAPSLRREWWQQGLALLRLWHRRAKERQQLAQLDARLLRDIGVSPGEAEQECNKPFWLA